MTHAVIHLAIVLRDLYSDRGVSHPFSLSYVILSSTRCHPEVRHRVLFGVISTWKRVRIHEQSLLYRSRDTNAAYLWSCVDENEVEDVLRKPGEDRPGREGARVAIGRTRAGRYLRIIYVPDQEGDSVFVITAYQLSGNPLMAYRRRRRKRL